MDFDQKFYKCLRIFVILLNINLLFFSFIIIIYGVGEKLRDSSFSGGLFFSLIVFTPSILMIILGIVTILLALFGLCSVDNYCQLIIYCCLIFLLASVDVFVGVCSE